ncbi:MAG: transposase [Candidatus Sumerlaeia bacterium]
MPDPHPNKADLKRIGPSKTVEPAETVGPAPSPAIPSTQPPAPNSETVGPAPSPAIPSTQPPAPNSKTVGPAPSPAIPNNNIPLPANLPPALSAFKERPLARPHKYFNRRRLPHYQSDGRVTFVTFTTFERRVLPESVRGRILQHCRHDDGLKMTLYCVVVMPDHVHMLYAPYQDGTGKMFGFAEIVGDIKSVSAHSINKALGRKGPVWQDERFDHILRKAELIRQKVEYIINNPVRRGLVSKPEDYKWLWVRPVKMAGEGAGPTFSG